MDKYQGKYFISEPPEWAEPITREQAIELGTPSEKGREVQNSGKQICFEFKQVINTQNTKTEDYIFRSWILNSPEVLQGAAIMEFILRDNECIKMHRVFVLRRGEIIDKIDDINIRIFDNEQSSSYGTIDNQKKVNCIVVDLRIGDIFFQEYSVETLFLERNFLDKKFFRFFMRQPSLNWFYMAYKFRIINNREEAIKTKKAYYRNSNGDKIPDEILVLKKGGSYNYEVNDHLSLEKEDEYNPYVEIVTDSTWEEISSYISFYYRELQSSSPEDCRSRLFQPLNLLPVSENLDEDIQKIIEFVQNQIVYLFDAEVMHGYIPEKAEKTLQVRSGDCKAKSFLLQELLKGLGIISDLILVNLDYDYHLGNYIPSPFMFNHMMIRIHYNEKMYFVDSTQLDRFGLLENRSQPLFTHYLPLIEGSGLVSQSQKPGSGFNIHQEISLSLKKDRGELLVESRYFRESADIVRGNYKRLSTQEFLDSETKNLYQIFCYPQERSSDSIFFNPNIELIQDDKKANSLQVIYKAQLIDPYTPWKNEKMFRCYYLIQVEKIKNFHHKDGLCSSFCFYPIRYVFKLDSDLFIKRNTSILRRNTQLENPHFTFTNKKIVQSKKLEVITEYSPKNYDYIQRDNLKKVIDDFKTIENSNFGVGAMFLNPFQFLLHLISLRFN